MLRHLVETSGEEAEILSRGVGTVSPGTLTEPMAVEAVRATGVPIEPKRAERLKKRDAEDADYCITMSAWQKAAVPFPNARTLDELTGCGDIPDPFGGDAGVYGKTAAALTEAVRTLFEKLFGGKK